MSNTENSAKSSGISWPRAIFVAVVFGGWWLLSQRKPVPNFDEISAVAPGRLRVTRAELGNAWPLTVDEAYVGCDQGQALWVARGKTTKERWALNGFALQNKIPDLAESGLWKPDPKIAQSKISITALSEKARSTCGTQ